MYPDRPGWNAINAYFEAKYPGVAAMCFTSLIPPNVDPHPCKQVDAWPAGDHWHLVSFGLTELFEKVSDVPDQDGWGYEFTFRVPRSPDEAGPPSWAAQTLRDLVRYADGSRQPIPEGDWIAFPDGFIVGTNLVAGVFTRDPSFPNNLRTLYGRFAFRQVVGITDQELAFLKTSGSAALLDRLRASDTSLVSRPGRTSVVSDADARPPRRGCFASIQAQVLRVSRAFNGSTELEIGRDDVGPVAEGLEQNVARGQPLAVAGSDTRIAFASGTADAIDFSGDPLHIVLRSESAQQLATALRAGTPDGAHVIDGLSAVQFRVVWQ